MLKARRTASPSSTAALAGADRALAGRASDTACGDNSGPVLFKPTLTEVPQTFRAAGEGALSCFAGGSASFRKDTGFALTGWKGVEIENASIVAAGDVATTMGNAGFTDKAGQVNTADKARQFKQGDAGNLRIVVHHPSRPSVRK